ncbi:MAG: alpha/beta hydrolase [Patescibacteria group bacterium]
MKRVFIVHGWEGSPEEGWFPWLKRELESYGFAVTVPAMPDPANPLIDKWVSYLKSKTGQPNRDTFFVGHSIGCQTILRLIEKENSKIGKVVLVAPWIFLSDAAIEDQESKEIASPWLTIPINFEKIKENATYTAIFSTNDPYVPLDSNRRVFENRLGAEIIIEENKKHFSGKDGVDQLPSALNAILEISKSSKWPNPNIPRN